jgi:hypothetical protein
MYGFVQRYYENQPWMIEIRHWWGIQLGCDLVNLCAGIGRTRLVIGIR